jgi:hypothetical protein
VKTKQLKKPTKRVILLRLRKMVKEKLGIDPRHWPELPDHAAQLEASGCVTYDNLDAWVYELQMHWHYAIHGEG